MITEKNTDLRFEAKDDLSLTRAMSLEWLETNGLGGYSSSTITCCNTRKYHGMLVPNLTNPFGKYVLLSKVEDEIILDDGKEYLLTSSQYPNHFEYGGISFLKEFSCDTHPCFTFQIGELIIIKEILLVHLENTVLIKYKILGDKKAEIRIRPMLAYRNFHDLAKANDFFQVGTFDCKWGRRIDPYQSMPPLFMQVSSGNDFISTPVWYRNFEYLEEQKRGFDFCEDILNPGVFVSPLYKEVIFSFSTKEIEEELDKKWDAEIARRTKLQSGLNGSPLQKQLQKVAQSFIQRDQKGNPKSVVAGYHWFLNWGRDAMISLPGLTLFNGNTKTCLAILKSFSEQSFGGLIPNFLGETSNKNAYNAIDVSLWFAWAVQQFFLKTEDISSIKKVLWQPLKSIFTNYKNGTEGVKMHPNGLLYAGNPNTNLTWMDAMVDGNPVTPRFGYQVEVNALWFNMLCFMQELAFELDDPLEKELASLIKIVKLAFRDTFWDKDLGYLCDFVNENEHNQVIRPNQIFAVSLPFSPLTKEMAIKIVNIVKDKLLTPYGLRTLAPGNPNYQGMYFGNSNRRDSAYHNGTVWPWLLGAFGEALIKVSSKKQAAKILLPCLDAVSLHLKDAGIGTISEIFDGDAPYKPNGCISQAWSVAEVLRLTYLITDIVE